MKYILFSLVLVLISFISLPCLADTGSGVSIPLTVTVTGGSSEGGGTYYGGGYKYVEPERSLITTEAPQSSATGYIPPAPPMYIPPVVGTTVYSQTGQNNPVVPSTPLINENFKWSEFGVVIFWSVMIGLAIAVIYYVWRKRQYR